MTLVIQLTPEQDIQLSVVARREGMEPAALVQRLVSEHLPGLSAQPASPLEYSDERRRAAIARLQERLEHGKTASPEEIERAEEEVDELIRNLNANREATGEHSAFAAGVPAK